MKRYFRGIVHFGMIGLGILLLINNNVLQGILLLLLSYFIFGFVALAFFFCSFKDFSKAQFAINFTVPYLLLRVEKSYYYFLKAVFAMESEKNYKKSMNYSLKVREGYLSTENDKSLYNSVMANLMYNQGDYKKALAYIEKAKEIPHKSLAEENYIKIHERIKAKLDEEK